MLNATAQKLGDSTVLRCQGRIVIGDAYVILRNAVLRQTHTRILILDLAQVDRIDAGGLGVLLGLREWACSHAIRFQLLHSAAAIAPRSVDRANQRIMKDCKYSVEWQDAPPAARRHSLPTGTAARAQEWAGVPADMQSAQTGARISNEGSASRQEYDSHS
jgi:anti-anti-sigma regulatory factor